MVLLQVKILILFNFYDSGIVKFKLDSFACVITLDHECLAFWLRYGQGKII